VGAARSRRIMERRQTTKLAKSVKDLRPYIKETHEILENAYARKKRVFLEGTQGTGLSLYHGSYPWVTSGDTTASGLMSEVGVPPMRVRKIILVCRTYPIRVQDPSRGTSGPMSQEIDWAEVSRRSGVDIEELEQRERTTTTNRRRRVAEFDWVLFR